MNLEEHKKNDYVFNNKKLKIKDLKEVNGKTVLYTNIRTFVFDNKSGLDDFINELKPYKEKSIVAKEETNIDNTYEDYIKKTLFEAINNVKDNPNYVKQANAICNITTQLINIKKLELQFKNK